MIKLSTFILTAFLALNASAETIQLPEPQKTGGMPLMEALSARKTQRHFDASARLDKQTLSDLLWAAFGVNREDGRRTAPTAINMQDILIYAALPEGVYLYDPFENTLEKVLDKDIRAEAGRQSDMTGSAAVVLLYVSDYDKMGRVQEPERQLLYAASHVGAIYQNVGLFAADRGMGNVALGALNYDRINELMPFTEKQHLLLGQAFGPLEE